MDYAKRAIRGSATIFMLSVVSIFLGFMLRAFLARSLSVVEFGLLYSVLAFIGLFSLFRDIGLNPALVKHIPEFIVKKDKKRIKSSFIFVFLLQFFVSLMVMLPVLLFSDLLAQNFFRTQLAVNVVHFLALTFIASVLFHLMQAFFQGFQNMRFYAILEPLRLASVLGLSVVFIALGFGVVGVSAGYFLGILIAGFIGLFLSLRIFPLISTKTKIEKGLVKQLFAFAFPVILAGIVSISTGYSDTLLLTFFKGLEDVGYYQVASPISEAAGIVVGAMSIVAFPMISELWIRREKNTVSDGVYLMIKGALLVLIPTAAVIISSPELIISILFTDKYLPAATALQILTISVVFQSLTIILFSILKGIGKPMSATKAVVILSVTDLAANLLLIPPFGIIGAALATTIAFMVTFFAAVAMVKSHIRIKFPYTPAAKAIFSGIVMIFFIASIKPFMPDNNLLKFIAASSVGLIIYLFLVSIFCAVRKKDMKVLEKIIYMPKWVYKFLRD